MLRGRAHGGDLGEGAGARVIDPVAFMASEMTCMVLTRATAKECCPTPDKQPAVREEGMAGAEDVCSRGGNIRGRSSRSTINDAAGVEVPGRGISPVMLIT